ncbi:MAG: phosphate signaling complex protein PhoU [Acidobacteriota bacterium]
MQNGTTADEYTHSGEVNLRLDILRDKILLLGGATEAAVQRGIRALTERNSELAQQVLDDDKVIDRMEVEIDRMSIEILAALHPTEHDLRFVMSVAKITPILERIADHAGSIAEAAIILNNEPVLKSYVEFPLMAATATEMLKAALDAFTSEDAVASREVIARDKEIDECYHRVFGELLGLMAVNPAATTGAAHLLFVAKHLERIGDYVKDICELNVYLREAVFIKHGAAN